MAERNLSYEGFRKLPEEERGKQYQNLSDADKFRVRQGMITADPAWIPCNDCQHRSQETCKAYPSGIPPEHILTLIENHELKCGDGFHFLLKQSLEDEK